jgi:two-component system, LytTR family, response regulator
MENNKLKVVLIDDEQAALVIFEQQLARYPELNVMGKITDPYIAASFVKEIRPDAVFLDIQMPGKDGFTVMKEIIEAGILPEFIFVTAYQQFAIEALRHATMDFLVKPVDEEELGIAINRLISKLKLDNHRVDIKSTDKIEKLLSRVLIGGKIKFPNGHGFIMVHPDDIIYIIADWNYSEVYSDTEHKELITTNLGNIEKILPAGQFFRITRSVIINLAYLSEVNRKKRKALLFKDGVEYSFQIPLMNIRKMERYLEDSN